MDEESFVKNLIHLTGGSNSAIGDDCAILDKFEPVLLATTDQLIRDIHYDKYYTGKNLAQKIVGANLSDIAAMGGIPTGALFYLATSRSPAKIKKLTEELTVELEKYQVELSGGDLSGSPDNSESMGLVILGKMHPDGILRRSGGKAGDLIALSGPLGGSAAIIDTDMTSRDKYRNQLCNIPDRLNLANKLVKNGVKCGIDISDGLLKDLNRLLASSKCGAIINFKNIPLSPPAKNLADNFEEALTWALAGGEDYELLVTFPEDKEELAARYNLRIIGRLTDEVSTIKFNPELPEKISINRSGYDHISG
ncbi:MAG: thiamine-phosphate kinase [bacterium]